MRRRVAWPAVLGLLAVLAGGARPAGGATTVAEASERLERADHLLSRQSSTNADILAGLAAVLADYRALASPPAGAPPPPQPLPPQQPSQIDDARRERDRFFDRAERLFLDALTLKRVAHGSNDNDRHEVQIAAARALGSVRPKVGAPMMQSLQHTVFKDHDYVRLPTFYEEAFRSLVRMGAPGVFEWLTQEGVDADADDDSQTRTLAALRAMTTARNVSARSRFLALKRCISIFQMYDFNWPDDYDELAGWRGGKKYEAFVHIPYWIVVRETLLPAMRHFCTDPPTLLPPVDPDFGGDVESVARYMTWFRMHDWKERYPPWREGAPPDTDLAGSRPEGRYAAPAIDKIERKYGVPWQVWWSWTRDVTSRPTHVTTPKEGDAAKDSAFLESFRRDVLPPLLRQGLKALEPEIRAVACGALGKLGGADVASLLHRRLADDRSERVREAACLGLLLLREAAERDGFRALADDPTENPRVRGTAVLGLGYLADVEGLRPRFAAPTPSLAGPRGVPPDLEACGVLARAIAREPGYAQVLVDLIRRDTASDGARGTAGTALAWLADPKTLPDLLQILSDSRRREVEQVPKVAAALALETALHADSAGAWRPLRAFLEGAKDRFAHVRDLVVLALGSAGGTTAREILEASYAACVADTQRPAERGYYLLALARNGSAEARSDLRAWFRTLDHERDAAACAIASAVVHDAVAIPPIRDRLIESRMEFTAHGMVALAMLGDPEAVVPIRDVVRRRSEPEVITGAALALAVLLGEGALPDLLALWDRCSEPEDFDAMAWALRAAAGPKTVDALLSLYADANRPAIERAFALAALGRIADPASRPLVDAFGAHFNPYVDAPTIVGLARHRDVPFLY